MCRSTAMFAVVLAGISGCRDPVPVVVNQPPAQPVVVQRPVVVAQPDLVTKDIYVTGMREKLAEFDRQYATWYQMKEKATGERKQRMTTSLGELKMKRDQFEREVHQLAANAEVAWSRTKGNCDRSYTSTRDAFATAAPNFI